MTLRVEIAPAVLQWAIERTGLSLDELANRSQTKAVRQWIAKDANPTLNQAEDLARLASIPFGYLLLGEPTDDTPAIADFRTKENQQLSGVSPDLEETLLLCKSRLSFYREYSTTQGVSGPEFVGSFSLKHSAAQAADEVKKWVEWKPGQREPNRERVLTLADAIEKAGVLVMRSSVVGNSTKRKLDVGEFRGFTLIDQQFALIFINGSDAKVGQLFSLGHELGHVLLGEPGVSGDRNLHRKVEQWCNEFAAELLVQTSELVRQFEESGDLGETVKWAYERYGVSRDVAVWALVDAEAISREVATDFLRTGSQPPQVREPSGGSFWNTIRIRLGGRFLDTVTGAALDGDISVREASQQLGIEKTETVLELISRYEGAA